MKSIEFVVLTAFGLFWLVFFLLLCYYASRKKRVHGRRDFWQGEEDKSPRGGGQYMGALGWFQRYQHRQNEGKQELNLL